MKLVVRLATMALFLFCAQQLLAADFAGSWKGSFDFQGTNVPLTVNLSVSGAAVTGSVLRPEASPATIHEGKVDGDAVSFWIEADYQGAIYKLLFKGKANGDALDFVFGTEDGSWGTSTTLKRAALDATKPAKDATGSWKGAFDFQGNSVPLTFHFKSAGGVLTGTVEGLPAGSAEIHDGGANDVTLHFSVMTEYQGTPVKLVFSGRFVDAGIKFIFGTEDGSWGTELVAGKS